MKNIAPLRFRSRLAFLRAEADADGAQDVGVDQRADLVDAIGCAVRRELEVPRSCLSTTRRFFHLPIGKSALCPNSAIGFFLKFVRSQPSAMMTSPMRSGVSSDSTNSRPLTLPAWVLWRMPSAARSSQMI